MDTIFVNGLEVFAIIGVYDWERESKQKILIDFEITLDTSKAGASDCLEETIDYGALSKQITTFVEESTFKLAETLCSRIADICLQDKRARSVTVKLSKPYAVANTNVVGVEITRQASQ